MRILRLTDSNETSDVFPPAERQYAYVEHLLAERFGETVETVLGSSWPSRGQPDRVSEAMERHEPDIVFLVLSDYAYNFHSLPNRVGRRFGWFGSRTARLLVRAGAHPTIGRSRLARRARLAFHRVFTGESFIEPKDFVQTTEETVQRVLRSEGTIAAIHGTSWVWSSNEWGEWNVLAERQDLVATSMREMVRRRHVSHIDWTVPFLRREIPRLTHSDGLHASWLWRVAGAMLDELLLAGAICEQRGLPLPDSALIERIEQLRQEEGSFLYDRISEDSMAFIRRFIPRVALTSSLGTVTVPS